MAHPDERDARILGMLHEAALLLANGERIVWVTVAGRLVGFQLELPAPADGSAPPALEHHPFAG